MTYIPRLFLGLSASSAIISILPELMKLREKHIGEFVCVMTPNAARLYAPALVSSVLETPVFSEFEDLSSYGKNHVSLMTGVQAALIAPATANTLTTVSLGLSPNLLTTCIAAYRGPVALLPSVNENVRLKTSHRRVIDTLRSDGFIIGEEEPAAASDLRGLPLPGVSRFGLRRLVVALADESERGSP